MDVGEFISEWWGKEGGRERSNFPVFVEQLCRVLGVDTPGPAIAGKLGPYEYEGPVPGGSFRSLKGTGAIDLYRRGHFIMEAKQSYIRQGDARQADLELDETAPQAPSGARYDKLMRDARRQAENYARYLPASEPVAPFLIVCDIGRAFEIYVDAAGNGRGYQFFPDKQSYRIELPELASDRPIKGVDKTPLELLRAIWRAPKSVDPRFHAAAVTRQVAANLAEVSRYLEEGIKRRDLTPREKAIEIEESSLFLMRVLFCMFAEDVGLLPEDSFRDFLKRAEGNDQLFANGLRDLFEKMNNPDEGSRFAMALEATVRWFNGGLFESSKTYPLGGFLVHNLYEAARQNWRRVEPAIFGTLLEQALDEDERKKLGAHYTPRPYVETLVRATIMDVLEPEWEQIEDLPDADILAAAQAFHEKLATIRVLDPACGTGNFLYVAMELLQVLESRVIERIQTLGGNAEPRVGPQQFFGLELNPRAAKIAELVLWIGWLRNQLKDDPDAIPEPVLANSANINFGRHGRYDAILRRTETGEPDYANPLPSEWPEAEFIVGNPPFIGKGAQMRDALGDEYVEALWRANDRVPKSADFVLQWWARAADILAQGSGPLIRFGFVTTNLITGSLNRKVVSRYLSADNAISLVFAIPDHPWTKATKDAAAVRIAMTVCEAGKGKKGQVRQVVTEANLGDDDPKIVYEVLDGSIHSNLRVGTNLTDLDRLRSNLGLSSNGMLLAGTGFRISRSQAKQFQTEDGDDVPIKSYIGGSELMQRGKDRFIIDFFGLTESGVRGRFPRTYSHVLGTVKPGRKDNRKAYREERWWEFGENNPLMRQSLVGLERYIATTETTKHRVFQFVDGTVIPDHMIIGISLEDPYFLGVLSSSFHEAWSRAISSPLGVATKAQGHRYNKSQIFDTFPFPIAIEVQRARIAELAEELDATRKAAIAETERLTMTELYNLREKLRSGDPLSDKDQRRATEARAGIVNRIHEQLDQAVAEAYGWGEEWRAGTLGPSEIVARLVALNHARAAEERQGHVRWLRPDYQRPRFGAQADKG